MNDLDLPPRRTLPPEVRNRIRHGMNAEAPRSRYKAPLSVAAAVVVLAAAAAMIVQSSPPSTTPADRLRPTTTSTVNGPPTDSELMDDCARVIEASPLADEYPARSTWYWNQIIGISLLDTGIIVFHAADQVFFCEINDGVASVSPPDAPRVPLASGAGGTVYGLYVTPGGFLVGLADGLGGLRMEFETGGQNSGEQPPVHNDVFFALVPGLVEGGTVHVTGRDQAGNVVVTGDFTYDPAQLRRPGASGRY